MNTGQHAFTVMFNYNLAALNNAATSPLAGQFALALMPGETHECYGFAKFYNMTQMAVDRGQEIIDASRQFHPVLRRRSRRQLPVAKRWAVEQGLGFGQIPLLDDPEVIEAYLQVGRCRLWREQLELGAGPAAGDLVRHLERDLPSAARSGADRRDHAPTSACKQSADAWNELKASVEG